MKLSVHSPRAARNVAASAPARRVSLPRVGAVAAMGLATMLAAGCTQESQNQLGRSIQNWTGTNGVLDVLQGDKVYMRFIQIDKLSTALATEGKRFKARPYRFGYGIHDRNFNYKADPGEKKVYFEVSDYSTPYVFYENDGQ
jgi:hypothetical protein